jgi:sulfatase maturation enzyme AslB (radical SAM superfamily)
MWAADHKKMYPEFQHPALKYEMEWDRKKFNNFWHENPVFWEQIYSQIPNLKQLYFAGGEPLMIKEHKLFLEEIIRQGHAKNILVRYNSNAILLEDDIVELWKHFRQVKFGVSMDGIGSRLNYIRYPTDFSRVEEVLDKLALLVPYKS